MRDTAGQGKLGREIAGARCRETGQVSACGAANEVSGCLPERGMPVLGGTLEDTTVCVNRLGARLIR